MGPQKHRLYSSCSVNGVNFVIEHVDIKLKTQNCGVMMKGADGNHFYDVLEAVVELVYAYGFNVFLFKCRWFDTNPNRRGSTIWDAPWRNDMGGTVHEGLLSVDSRTSWYEDAPFILAKDAIQVFYLDDPKAGPAWKVVNVV